MAKKNQSGSIISLGRHGLKAIGEQTKDDAGNPVQQFEARILRIGHFDHPTADWKLDIDGPRLKKYLASGEKMLKAGASIPITSKHFTDDARDTLGAVESLKIRDNWLIADVEMTGEDAIKAASRNHVSVEIEPDVSDASGNKFGEAITSIALTPKPVVTGQQRIAASNDADAKSARVYFFSQEAPTMKTLIEQLAELSGITDLSEDNMGEKLKPVFDKSASVGDLQTQLKAATEKATGLQAKLDASGKKPEVDADIVQERAETTQEGLDSLVVAGKLTPAASDKLAAALIGPDDNRNVIALSTTAAKAAGLPRAYAKAIVDALKENDPKVLRDMSEKTSRQTLALSRPTPGGEAEHDPNVTNEMIEMAGGKKAG